MAFTCFCVSGGDSYLQIERQHPACIIRRGMSQSLHKDSTVSSSSRGRDVLLNSGPQASLSSTSGCSWPKQGQLSVKRTWCWPCCELVWSMSLCLHTCAVMLIVHSFIHSFLPSFIHSSIHSINQSNQFNSIHSFTDSLATAQRRLFWGLFCAALFNILQGKVSLHTNSICSSEYSGFHSFHPHAGNPTWHQCVLQLEIPGFLYWDSWYIMFISFISLFIYHNVHHCLSNSS